MIEEIDVWRAAKMLVDQHGDEAPFHAAMRVEDMLERGDLEGRQVWKKIIEAAENLLQERGDDRLH